MALARATVRRTAARHRQPKGRDRLGHGTL